MKSYTAWMDNFVKNDYLYLIFILAFVSVFGSLFFQYYLNLPPCNLCIVQRYFMYPLLPITAILILLKKKIHSLLFLVFSIPGGLVAAYHVYIQSTGTPNASFIPCNTLQPCEVIDLKLLGFITIPMLSLVSFIFITVLVMDAYYLSPHKSVFRRAGRHVLSRFGIGTSFSTKNK